jgi:hypothetical protein
MMGWMPPRSREAPEVASENPFVRQYLPTMKKVWKWIREVYEPAELWGPATQLVLWQSALRCHGDLPVGCGILALVAGCTNGGITSIFVDSPTPLNYWNLNSNYPQTRKSEISKLLSAGARELDRLIQYDFVREWEEAVDEAEADADARQEDYRRPEVPVVHSVEIPSCTPEDLFQRLACDWDMVANLKESASGSEHTRSPGMPPYQQGVLFMCSTWVPDGHHARTQGMPSNTVMLGLVCPVSGIWNRIWPICVASRSYINGTVSCYIPSRRRGGRGMWATQSG